MKDVTSHTGGHVKATPWSKPSLPLLLLLSFAISVGLGVYALVTLRSVLVYERGVDLGRTAEGVADTIDCIRNIHRRPAEVGTPFTDEHASQGYQCVHSETD